MSFVSDKERQVLLRFSSQVITGAQLLQLLGINAADVVVYGVRLLEHACDSHDAEAVSFGLDVGFEFGLTREYWPPLSRLAPAEWHTRHEDVISAIDDLRVPEAVDLLLAVAEKRFDYLDYDDAFALGVKCIWALGNIGTVASVEALAKLTRSSNSILAQNAREQLARLHAKNPDPKVRAAARSTGARDPSS